MYRANLPVGELYKQLDKYKGWRVKYTGSVLSIQTLPSNLTFIQLTVDPPMGDPAGEDVVDVATSIDCTGIIENSRITVWGEPDSTTTITNSYGGQVDQPMLGGVYIQKLGD